MQKVTRRLFLFLTSCTAAFARGLDWLFPSSVARAQGRLEVVMISSEDTTVFRDNSRWREHATWRLLLNRETFDVESCVKIDPQPGQLLPPRERPLPLLHERVARDAAEFRVRYLVNKEPAPFEAEDDRARYQWLAACHETEQRVQTKERPLNPTETRVLAELQALRFESGTTGFEWLGHRRALRA